MKIKWAKPKKISKCFTVVGDRKEPSEGDLAFGRFNRELPEQKTTVHRACGDDGETIGLN